MGKVFVPSTSGGGSSAPLYTWYPIFGQGHAPDAQATVVLANQVRVFSTALPPLRSPTQGLLNWRSAILPSPVFVTNMSIALYDRATGALVVRSDVLAVPAGAVAVTVFGSFTGTPLVPGGSYLAAVTADRSLTMACQATVTGAVALLADPLRRGLAAEVGVAGLCPAAINPATITPDGGPLPWFSLE